MNFISSISRNKIWFYFISLSTLIGFFLRTLFLEDMEFKEDEHYNFIQSQLIGTTDPWPPYGIPSGVYLPNPGLSVWIFVFLAKLTRAHDPVVLTRNLGIFNWAGILLILPFVFYFIPQVKEKLSLDQKIWLWSFCLAMVNPFSLLYGRKLWPEPFLPFFLMLTLMAWVKRKSFLASFIWGFLGALIGQIHMSGFFSSAALFVWTLLYDIKKKEKINLRGWLLGSFIGILPLLPWLTHIVTHPLSQAIPKTLNEILQFKFWVFWISDPLGFHLGNPLGLLRGNSTFEQISDFIRYPLLPKALGEHATYFNGATHVLILILSTFIFLNGIYFLFKKFKTIPLKNFLRWLFGFESPLSVALGANLFGFGLLLTLTGTMIRRYYMVASFPFEFVFLAHLAYLKEKGAEKILFLLWLCELIVSIHFIGYVHVKKGSPQGDYGNAFHVIKKENLKRDGKPWPDRPLQYY